MKGWSETLKRLRRETYRKGMKVITHETGRLEGMVESFSTSRAYRMADSRCKWQIPTS
ncbi:MAG: hypothetical protein ACLSG5_09735 [Oscillospiraceae bacterium]